MAEQSVKKAPEKKSDKKPGFFAKVTRFFRELRAESNKIVWPSKKQVINNTGIVVGVMAVVGAGIWIIDWLFTFLRGLILG